MENYLAPADMLSRAPADMLIRIIIRTENQHLLWWYIILNSVTCSWYIDIWDIVFPLYCLDFWSRTPSAEYNILSSKIPFFFENANFDKKYAIRHFLKSLSIYFEFFASSFLILVSLKSFPLTSVRPTLYLKSDCEYTEQLCEHRHRTQ